METWQHHAYTGCFGCDHYITLLAWWLVIHTGKKRIVVNSLETGGSGCSDFFPLWCEWFYSCSEIYDSTVSLQVNPSLKIHRRMCIQRSSYEFSKKWVPTNLCALKLIRKVADHWFSLWHKETIQEIYANWRKTSRCSRGMVRSLCVAHTTGFFALICGHGQKTNLNFTCTK